MHPIVKTYLDAGYIDQKAADRLCNFENMTKEAGFWDKVVSGAKGLWSASKEGLSKHGPTIALSAGIQGAGLGAGYLLTQRAKNKDRKLLEDNLNRSYNQMLSEDPIFSKNESLTRKRFNEMAGISPTIASNPTIASKMLKKTLVKGLDEDQANTLFSIEANSKAVSSLTGRTPLLHSLVSEKMPSYMLTQLNEEAAERKGLGREVLLDEHRRNLNFEDLKLESMVADAINSIQAGYPAPPGMTEFTNFFKNNPNQGRVIILDALKKGSLSTNDLRMHLGGFEKKGGLKTMLGPTVFSALKKGVLGLGVAGSVGAGFGAVHEIADYKKSKKLHEKINNAWVETDKELRGLSAEGSRLSSGIDYNDKAIRAKAHKAFSTLAAMAPSIAADPNLARSFVNTVMLNEGAIDPATLKTLTDTQKNLDSIHEQRSPFANKPWLVGFDAGFRLGGGEDLVTGMAKSITGTK